MNLKHLFHFERSFHASQQPCCRGRRLGACLRTEQLEARECLAVTMVSTGDLLTINGDAHDNVINVTDNGGGSLSVNGKAFSGIHRLICDTKGGADSFQYSATGVLSLSCLDLDLGLGDDIAVVALGVVAARLQSEIRGGAGKDAITTEFGAVAAGVTAKSSMDGGLGDDLVSCVQRNVAGSAICNNHGGAGDDMMFCESTNVLADGRSECISDGGLGDDVMQCTKAHVAGYANCVGDGGAGDDYLSCILDDMAESGSALCHQTGGLGNDTLLCEAGNVAGEHECFQDGGAGNDTLNWIVKGVNTANAQCSLYGGAGNDVFNGQIGTATDPVTIKSGTVSFFLDAGAGNDRFVSTANLAANSNATISSISVLMGRGNDSTTLNYYYLGGALLADQLYDGGRGVDVYAGTIPAEFLPLINFENVG